LFVLSAQTIFFGQEMFLYVKVYLEENGQKLLFVLSVLIPSGFGVKKIP